jgi:hypothetical protein
VPGGISADFFDFYLILILPVPKSDIFKAKSRNPGFLNRDFLSRIPVPVFSKRRPLLANAASARSQRLGWQAAVPASDPQQTILNLIFHPIKMQVATL